MARKRKRREEEAGFGEATAGFTDDPAAPTRERLTPVDVQQKVFRLAFRGYNERDVDEFLDQVTEDLAALHEENKRLREQIAEGGTGTGPEGGAAARQQAEAIVRQAREHAARLIGDAERRVASAGAGAGVSAAPSSYLVREREFLQTLASLVQEHARTLKEEAQQARAAAARTKEEKEEQPQPEQRPSTPASEEAAAAAATTGTAAGTPPPTPSGTPGARGTPGSPGTPGTEEPEMTEGGASRGASSEASDASSDPGARAVVIPPAASETEAEAHSPVKVETASASTAEGPSEAAADRTEGGEPLLSAWETAFSDEDETPSRKEDQARRGDRERSEEPSLRELFWGEE